MKYEELKRLKSGTDVRGVASGDGITLTDEAVCRISRAFVKWLGTKFNRSKFKIAVGNDSRISAPRIVKAVTDGIISCGSDVVYTGLSSTPSMFILLRQPQTDCDASVMITASHLPSNRNGLKFFTPDGGLDGSDIDDILKIAADGQFPEGKGSYGERPFMDEYSAILVENVRKACGDNQPLKGLKIIVDAGNGAGGFFESKVLVPLGADTRGSQFLEPDGTFPNHIPNPEDGGAIASLSSAVIKNRADLGIIFDTDVDRAGAVDRDGKEINRNRLIALVSAMLLKERRGTIVTDSVTSDGLAEFIKAHGGEHLRYKRGYKNVIDKCRQLNEQGIYSPLAIETSGHAAFKDNYFLDDGAYLVTRILITLSEQAKKGSSISELISSLPEPEECAEVRLRFNENSVDFRSEGAKVIDDLKAFAASDKNLSLASQNYEGARINFPKDCGDGWVLVRMSVHDPVMPINFESNRKGGTKIIAKKIYELVSGYPFLETENLKKYITI